METFKCLKTSTTSLIYQTTTFMLLWTAFVRKHEATPHNTRLAFASSSLTKSNGQLSLAPSLPHTSMLASLCMSLIYPHTMISLRPFKLRTSPTTFAEQVNLSTSWGWKTTMYFMQFTLIAGCITLIVCLYMIHFGGHVAWLDTYEATF